MRKAPRVWADPARSDEKIRSEQWERDMSLSDYNDGKDGKCGIKGND